MVLTKIRTLEEWRFIDKKGRICQLPPNLVIFIIFLKSLVLEILAPCCLFLLFNPKSQFYTFSLFKLFLSFSHFFQFFTYSLHFPYEVFDPSSGTCGSSLISSFSLKCLIITNCCVLHARGRPLFGHSLDLVYFRSWPQLSWWPKQSPTFSQVTCCSY